MEDTRDPEVVPELAALTAALKGEEAVVFEAASPLHHLRAASLAREFGLKAWVVGNGREYEKRVELATAGLTVALPLAFPKEPKLPLVDDGAARLEDLRHWKAAPRNALLLSQAGVHWGKFPVWFPAKESKRAEEIAWFAERLSSFDIALGGLLARPPAEVLE